MERRKDFLNNFYSAAQKSAQLASKLLFSKKQLKYSVRIESKKLHDTVWVDFRGTKPCEIGDILIVSKYIEPASILSRRVCFIQIKAANKRGPPNKWTIDKNQLHFYLRWPTIQSCYVGPKFNNNIMLQNKRIIYRNRLFSPYLLLRRNWHPCIPCNPPPWITGTDLVAAASRRGKTIRGPLELSFLSHLIRLLFQTTGERDILNNKPRNANLKQLIDNLLQYVKLNDPPEGEGRPFVVVNLTVKRVIEF